MVTVDELNEQMEGMFMSSQLNSIKWDKLSDGDKRVALNNAHAEINRLQFIGEKIDDNQVDAFPRILDKEVIEIPEAVKLAICQYCYDYIKILTNSRYDTIRAGVVSARAGSVSESYDLRHVNTSMGTYKKYLNGLIYRGGGR